jgi:tetratricopeptide (TPR) repeat protein
LALQHLRKALQAGPGSVDALYYLGTVCQALAQEQFRQMFAIAPDSARSHEFLARSYRAEGKTDEAMEEYRATLRRNPDSVEALNALGDMEWFQFHMDEAISYYTRASAINPRDFHSVYATGAAYLRQRDDERAADSFRRALALVPDSAMAHLGLGQALLRTEHADAAVVELRTAVELEPVTEICYPGGCTVSNQTRQAYILLGRAYQKVGKSQEAAAAFHQAEELGKQQVESHQRLDNAQDFVPESPGITQ